MTQLKPREPAVRAALPRAASRAPSNGAPSASPLSERIVYYSGERIYFRPLELEDESLLRRWINDPTVWSTLAHRQPVNAVREREWIEDLGKDPDAYTFGIVLQEGDRLIGSCGLFRIKRIDRSAMLGILIGDAEHRNKGYGTEAVRLILRFAFEELNLNRVGLSVFSHNPQAIRAYQKAGFVPEGCLRQACYRHGQYMNEYVFAVLREEWEVSGADGGRC